MSKLTKPQFVKVNSLLDCRNGYNVYVRVVSAEQSKSQDGQTTFVRAVVADETASVNAFFKGQTAKLIKKGSVIAIRNGRIRIIKTNISLQIDIFGRVTPQNIDIKENTKENISEKAIQRRPRRNNQDRPRRNNQDRPPRRQGEDRPRRNNQDRPPRRQGEDRPRRNNQDRPPRRQGEDRPRRNNQDRPPRRQGEDRPRRNNQDRPPRREGEDRPKRNYEDRPPRRQGQERGDRKPTQWTKVGAIQPGDDNLNLVVKVLSFQPVGKGSKARVLLGDETGTVKGFIYVNESVKQGNSIVIFKAVAQVVRQHIEIQLMQRGKVDLARREVGKVNTSVNISDKQWVEQS